MAGGFGSRIQPLTYSRPKPMLPIMNKPMMEHTMMMLKDLGIKEFIVLLYFKPEIIQNYFKDGSDFGIKITYVVPDNDYGTAGAVKLAQNLIGDENFIIISGDLVTDFDFQKLIDFHTQKKSKLSIGLTSVENPLQFGVVIANENNVIEKFLEKPSWGEVFSDTINTGIYIIEPGILNFIPEHENFDFAKDLFPLLMKQEIPLLAYNLSGYWRDVGNPESYREVYEDILNHEVDFTIDGYKKEYPDGTLYSSVPYTLDPSIEIVGTVVLDKNVVLKNGVKLHNVVIGENVVIGGRSKLKNSVLWEDITIENGTKLDNCVITNNNIIHKNVTAKVGLILAEGCSVGQLASFEQDVIIWPNKEIEPAAIVTHNLILGNKYKNSIFNDGGVSGKSNVEFSCEMASKLAEAFASQLPIGSKIIIGRDEDRASIMLKRAFLGGILSAGIDVVDIRNTPPLVLRYTLANDKKLVGGAYINRCTKDSFSSTVTLFDDEALRVKYNAAKTIEKAYFTEQFRRVDYTDIGTIYEISTKDMSSSYQNAIEDKINTTVIKQAKFKIAIDFMHGGTSKLIPNLLNKLGIENIILNNYFDEEKLSNIETLKTKSIETIASIVKHLEYNMGILIYPSAQKITLITEQGIKLNKVHSLYVVLSLLNLEESTKKIRVLLPTWAPDIHIFENLNVDRGPYSTFTAEQLMKYDLVATIDGNFSFCDFAYTRDAVYSTLKIIELLSIHNTSLSTITQNIDRFYYKSFQIECEQMLKGKMMRKFLESAKDKKSSTIDGVKIWEDTNDWILMIPDQTSAHLNIYIQAQDDTRGKAINKKYCDKIDLWSQE